MSALCPRRALLVGCSLLLLGGCTRSTGFRSASVNDKICEICTINGDAVLVLLADECSRSTAQTGISPAFQGRFVTNSGREISWTCDTSGGRNGTVTIDLQQFELAAGQWFQITPVADGLDIVQFRADTKSLNDATVQAKLFDQLEQMSPQNEQIAAFLKN